jgi:1-acyl-sn-glycerol-3-phosphate acyltransferase
MRQYLGSALFSLTLFGSIFLFAPVIVLLFMAPYHWRYEIAKTWSRLNLWVAELACGIHYTVEGAEQIPDSACIIFSKHQSAWETLALQMVFPPQVWVLKRELIWVPMFGWALGLLEPIAIDRSAGRRAVQSIVEQGKQRLETGRWIVVFPEGTRVAPGVQRKWGVGGAVLAARSGRQVVPVAHNAGELWPRRGFLKRPGTIRVVVGPAIDTSGRTPDEINRLAREWMDTQMQRISGRHDEATD